MSSEHVEVLWAMLRKCVYERLARKSADREAAALAAAIASLSAPQSGDWVLVPREPSVGMWDSAEKAMIEAECAYNAGGQEARSDAHGFPTMRIWQAVVGYRAMLAAAPQPPAEAQPVVWSADKPGRPGVYGVRGFNLCREPEEQFEAVVSVRLYEGDLICNLHEYTSEEDFDRWTRVEDCSDGFEWCEFVPAHPPPSAPVGVEAEEHANVLRDLLADEYSEREDDGSPSFTLERAALQAAIDALAQQPAAVAPAGVGVVRRVAENIRANLDSLPSIARVWADDLDQALAAQQPAAAPCCMCGNPVDTRENGTPGAELPDGRWTCSHECFDKATGEQPAAVDTSWLLPILDAAAQGKSVSMAAGDAARRIRAGQQPAADNVPWDAGRVAVHFLARIFAAQKTGPDGKHRGWKISGKGSLNEVVAEARAWLAAQQPAAVDGDDFDCPHSAFDNCDCYADQQGGES